MSIPEEESSSITATSELERKQKRTLGTNSLRCNFRCNCLQASFYPSSKRLQKRVAVLQDSSGYKIAGSQTQANLFSYVFALSYRSDDGAEPQPLYHDAVQIST